MLGMKTLTLSGVSMVSLGLHPIKSGSAMWLTYTPIILTQSSKQIYILVKVM